MDKVFIKEPKIDDFKEVDDDKIFLTEKEIKFYKLKSYFKCNNLLNDYKKSNKKRRKK